MSWRSLEELSKEFDLDTSTDREATRRALQRRLGTLHPDKTGSELASNEQKGEFHRLSEALQFLARVKSHAGGVTRPEADGVTPQGRAQHDPGAKGRETRKAAPKHPLKRYIRR